MVVCGAWNLPPSEFWRMHPREFWYLYEAKTTPEQRETPADKWAGLYSKLGTKNVR